MKPADLAAEFADPIEADPPPAPALAPEPKAFSGFFESEWPRLKNYLRRFVGEDAEEVAQEAFARVFAVSGEVRSMTGLLYQTARNLVIDRKRRRAVAGGYLVEHDATELVPDPRPLPEDAIAQRQRLERAAAMIERMPRRCREVFLLQVLDGFSYAEIAAKLGISVSGVKMHLMRAFEICAAHAEAEARAEARVPGERRRLRFSGGSLKPKPAKE